MSNQTIPNHYEALQVSQSASLDVIEKMFRFLATKHHPDAGGDKKLFTQIVEAYEVLRDDTARAIYDLELKQDSQEINSLIENSKEAGPDAAIRHELLCLFYARRREQGSTPALGVVAIEKAMNMPEEVLQFHIWYFREKGWIARWEDGGFAITAEGVDQIDNNEWRKANQLHIAAAPQAAAPGAMVPV